MKKLLWILVVTVILSLGICCTASAAVGDKVGDLLHTDIVAYINHYALDSFAANGQSVICAEDLVHYGFDVVWNEAERSLTISRNSSVEITSLGTEKWCFSGEVCCDILETDIRVFANGKQLTSYCVDGDVMIPIEELTVFGAVYWVESERAIKLWIDGLPIAPIQEKPVIYSVEDMLYQYLVKKYEYVQTAAGVYEFDFTVYKNDNISSPYDYAIWTEFNFSDFYNLEYSISFSQSQRNQAKYELKLIQQYIAYDSIRLLPGKKIQGFYSYYNSRNGALYHSYDWANYTGSYGTDAYYKSKLTGFHWTNEAFLRNTKRN